MKPVTYVRAGSVAEAAAAHAGRPEARYLGGGTNLVDLMKLGVERPDVLIDITRLPLDQVEESPDGALRIGATVRNTDLAAHPLVRERYPVLSQAVLSGASGQLRNVATTAETSSSAPAAPTSRTWPSRATSGCRAAAAAPWTASTATTRCSATRNTASPPTPPTWPWRWRPSTRWSRWRGPAAAGPSS